jgi:DNA-binding IclR family transcriptional regulator
MKGIMERNTVKSAARVIQILEFFDQVKRAATVAELAEHHGWPHSSTSILMRSLVALGYLHYDPSNRAYLPSMRVALLGDWLQNMPLKNGQLTHLLQHLNDETGETIVLAAQNGLHAQYLRVLQGTNVVRTHFHISTLRPLLNSGTGRMLITRMDDAGIRKLTRKHNAHFDAERQVDIKQVFERLASDREKGYALSVHQVTPYTGVIATLLPTPPGEQPLVIGIAGLSQRLISDEQRYVDAMRRAIKLFSNE